ncbi:TrmH family RNA methyltransferase [Leptospira ilyithenensis]|uniref:RNA methyltransferase n=1 Tax=Leptospira ilyithenensis TaxID=2484901 RepID=A0A4R9LRM9_9LEPT|nr:RNA methyltransferase [Leptospira ilyithenensis]TGN13720.1 RNA methyltransferase [Leptospira ilyithenensis]
MISIQDPFDPRVSPYSLLKSKEETSDCFIADNEKTVVRLLESDLEVVSIFATERFIRKHLWLMEKKKIEPTNIFYAEKTVFEKTIGFSVHQGIMALGKKPISILVKDLKLPIVVCNNISDAENFGSIIRTSAAFGIKSIIYDKQSSSPYLRRSVRVSMGNGFPLHFFKSDSLYDLIQEYRQENIPVIGLALPNIANNKKQLVSEIFEFQFPEKYLLVLGNEADGIDAELKSICDHLVYIPMSDGVDSLNVSHSLAVALAFSRLIP